MKVVIADDSAIVRVVFEQKLKAKKDIEIVDSVSNGRKAIDTAQKLKSDVVILDDDMPEIPSTEAAEKISADFGIPVLFLTEKDDFKYSFSRPSIVKIVKKPKPSGMAANFFNTFIPLLKQTATKSLFNGIKEKIFASDSEKQNGSSNIAGNFSILCIGASTGGHTAVQTVLQGLGKNFPLPILYAQHIEIGDNKNMATWFSESCPNVKFSLAKDGEEALPEHVYMAPAGIHLVVDYINSRGNPVLHLNDDPPVRFLKPSVDKTFFSAAIFYKEKYLAALLTGMGADGAAGCNAIVDAVGFTIAEDKATCAVLECQWQQSRWEKRNSFYGVKKLLGYSCPCEFKIVNMVFYGDIN